MDKRWYKMSTDKGLSLGWAIVGWMNMGALVLIILLVTGVRPTAAQILWGGLFYLIMTGLLIWNGLRKR